MKILEACYQILRDVTVEMSDILFSTSFLPTNRNIHLYKMLVTHTLPSNPPIPTFWTFLMSSLATVLFMEMGLLAMDTSL